MKIVINKEEHEVVYIEYRDGLPFDVKTLAFIGTVDKPYWRLFHWDFFLNNGDKDDLRHYNSGSGGSKKDIRAPQFIDGYTGKIWVRSDIKLRGKGSNFKIIKHPLRLNIYNSDSKTTNPFKASEESNSEEYCDKCGYYSTEFCTEHKYDDKDGNQRWKSDDTYVE
jgi:hypothetical protein